MNVPLSNLQLYLSGAGAGIGNSMISCPVEHIRIRTSPLSPPFTLTDSFDEGRTADSDGGESSDIQGTYRCAQEDLRLGWTQRSLPRTHRYSRSVRLSSILSNPLASVLMRDGRVVNSMDMGCTSSPMNGWSSESSRGR
jgi:hypothetical protein